MTGQDLDTRIRYAPVDAASLRIGGWCALIGAVAFGTFRVLHGDTPGADPAASLAFVAGRPDYAGVHLGAAFAAMLGVAGLVTLARSMTTPAARTWAFAGLAAAVAGLGIFGVESTSEGLALPELAHAAAAAGPPEHAELVQAARAVLAVTHGPSLIAVSFLYGFALLGFGLAIIGDRYPSSLGWAGLGVGMVTVAAAAGQYLDPELMPGFLIYGVLASILAQLWLVGGAVAMLRRARAAA